MPPNKLRHLRPAQPAVAGRPSYRWKMNRRRRHTPPARRSSIDCFWFLSRDFRRTDEDDANDRARSRMSAARDAYAGELESWSGSWKNLPRLPERVRHLVDLIHSSASTTYCCLSLSYRLGSFRLKLNSSRINIISSTSCAATDFQHVLPGLLL